MGAASGQLLWEPLPVKSGQLVHFLGGNCSSSSYAFYIFSPEVFRFLLQSGWLMMDLTGEKFVSVS